MTSAHLRPDGRLGGVPRGMKAEGPVLLSYGFRPFFLFGASFAVLAMALWIAALTIGLPLGGSYGAPAWHAHEMVFGFSSAVLAGFLLTAVPNWTGRLPVAGLPLAGLVALWLAGRIGMAVAGWIGDGWAAALDAAFLPTFWTVCAREILAGKKWKDLKVLAAVGVVALANLGWHLAALTGADMALAARGAVAGYTLLIMIIGGRIIPSFTRNWLNRMGNTTFPAPHGRFDNAAILMSLPALIGWVIAPEHSLTILAALVAAALNAARLSRWRGLACWPDKLVFVLHAGFALSPLGFLSIAAAGLGWISGAGALHVFTVGLMGGMMLAVMTRATRGHTGRALAASRLTVASYLSLLMAALARPLADLIPEAHMPLLHVAACGWMLAFALFLIEYAPMLALQRRPLRGDG